jgi:hypothetical protein
VSLICRGHVSYKEGDQETHGEEVKEGTRSWSGGTRVKKKK